MATHTSHKLERLGFCVKVLEVGGLGSLPGSLPRRYASGDGVLYGSSLAVRARDAPSLEVGHCYHGWAILLLRL